MKKQFSPSLRRPLMVSQLIFIATLSLLTSGQECSRPTVKVRGEAHAIEDDFEKRQCGSFDCYVLLESKPVLYVPNFLNSSIAQELTTICEASRWQHSPVRGAGSTLDTVTAKHIRSSESCPLVPAATYLTNPKFIEIRQANSMPHLVREVDLAWHVSEQAAQLLGQSPEAVEPLQVVRYTSPAAEYHVHHDHGGFYGKSTEARPWTVLVFLAQPFDGGYTSFPKLVLDVLPRTGDALVWRNVLSDDTADPEMVHAGLPPTRGEKYALNVWFSNTNDKANLLTGLWGTTQVARKLYNKE